MGKFGKAREGRGRPAEARKISETPAKARKGQGRPWRPDATATRISGLRKAVARTAFAELGVKRSWRTLGYTRGCAYGIASNWLSMAALANLPFANGTDRKTRKGNA